MNRDVLVLSLGMLALGALITAWGVTLRYREQRRRTRRLEDERTAEIDREPPSATPGQR